MKRALAALCATTILAAQPAAQPAPPSSSTEWRAYAGDLRNHHY